MGSPGNKTIFQLIRSTIAVLAVAYLAFHFGQRHIPQQAPPSVPLRTIHIAPGRTAVYLDFSVPRRIYIDERDISRGPASGGGSNDVRKFLGTPYYPAPLYPTVIQYDRLLAQIKEALSAASLQLLPRQVGGTTPDLTPTLSIWSTFYYDGKDTVLNVHVELMEYGVDPKTHQDRAMIRPERRFQYMGARHGNKVWPWAHDATMHALNQFITGYRGG